MVEGEVGEEEQKDEAEKRKQRMSKDAEGK